MTQKFYHFDHRRTVNRSVPVSESSTRLVYGRARIYQHCSFQVRHLFILLAQREVGLFWFTLQRQCTMLPIFSYSIARQSIYWSIHLTYSSIAAATASTLASTLPALDQEESGGNAAAAAAVDTSVLQRGYRFFGRVIRTALPIQAVMLLVLGVASLVPTGNDSCMDANTFANSLEFVLRYPDGAPPT